MQINTLSEIKDFLHAQLCYQFFITPFHLPVEKQYRDFAKRACEYLSTKRSEIIHSDSPRHYVMHRFKSA